MAKSDEKFIAGVELGGTTCVAAISNAQSPTKVIHRFETATTVPGDTLRSLCTFLKKKQLELGISSYNAIGIASFGPVDLKPDSKTYGFITTTPKPGWERVNVLGEYFRREFGVAVPIGFETDVNAPALAEALSITDRRRVTSANVVYITVGTGVGVGVVANGAPIHGLMHPEGGHMVVPRMPGDEYSGCCAWKHNLCVEGMVNSHAIAGRTGVDRMKLNTLPDGHEVWEKVGNHNSQSGATELGEGDRSPNIFKN